MPQASLGRKQIPRRPSSSIVREIEELDFSKGIDTYTANDAMLPGFWRLAQDARIGALGEYETRKAADFHSDAAGEAINTSQTSTTGAADRSFNETASLAQKFTTASAGRCSKLDIRLKNDASAAGEIKIELYTDNAGTPGALIATSSPKTSDLTSGYGYVSARFISAPMLANATAYWIVASIQAIANGNSYKWSSTTAASTAATSADSGGTWTTQSYALNFRAYLATDSPSKGVFRGYKSDGTKVTLLAHGTTLYSVNDATGALTAIKTGLSASATRYRFAIANDEVYYVNSYDGYRKWNFAVESQVTATNYSDLVLHKGLMFLVRADDPNRVDFSNFGDYGNFTSTDFLYVPSPKTGDPVTATVSLNGSLTFWTRFRKYVLYGDDNASFILQTAAGQKGSFTPDTVVVDKNYAYFLSDDGVYRFDGTSDTLMTKNIYEDVVAIESKDEACLAVNRGRLYMFYQSPGANANDQGIVFSLNFGSVESFDTGTYFTKAITAFNDDDALMVASSTIGQVYWLELPSNDYSNLGGPIQWELRNNYNPYGRPSQPKQIRFWKTRLGAQNGNYALTIQAAYDLRDSPDARSFLNVQGSGPVWGSFIWGEEIWGVEAEVEGDQYVPGEYRRIQLRYKHHAIRQPQRFLGHFLAVSIRRYR